MVDISQPHNLSQEQIQRLQAAMEKRRSVIPPKEKKIIVPPAEYARRLQEDMARDSQLAERARKDNIRYNLQQWEEQIEDRWRDAKIENIESNNIVRERILDRVNRWETGRGMNQISMIFVGHLGRGKTWSAYAYCHELIRRGILTAGQVYISTESALAAIASSGYEKEKRLKSLLSPRYKLYLIDDIGRGSFPSGEGARGEVWFEILNHIYSRRLAFVGTTNLSLHPTKGPDNKPIPPEMQRWIGSAAFERLGHMVGKGGYIPFRKDGRDMRKEKAEEWEREYLGR